MLTKEETDVTLDPNNEDQIYELDWFFIIIITNLLA
jgi:hypothetical protein